jgi:hypothetical protein
VIKKYAAWSSPFDHACHGLRGRRLAARLEAVAFAHSRLGSGADQSDRRRSGDMYLCMCNEYRELMVVDDVPGKAPFADIGKL